MDCQLPGIKIMLMKCIKKFGLSCIICLQQTKIRTTEIPLQVRIAGAHIAAQTLDVSKFKHDYLPLDNEVTKALKPIYTDLSSRELLERCKGGITQNNNESYNGLLWDFAPKHLHNGLKTIEFANFLAVYIKDGFYAILKMLQVMDVIISPIAKEYAMERDDR